MISRIRKLTKISLLIGLIIILMLGVIGLTDRTNNAQIGMNKKTVGNLDGLKIKHEVITDQNKTKNYIAFK